MICNTDFHAFPENVGDIPINTFDGECAFQTVMEHVIDRGQQSVKMRIGRDKMLLIWRFKLCRFRMLRTKQK